MCEDEILSKNKLIELDEDIDISKAEDINISKTEGIDISKTEDIDISKLKILILVKLRILIFVKLKVLILVKMKIKKKAQIGICSCECLGIRGNGMVKKMVIGKEGKLSGSFGITVMYQNYVKSGYILMANMHTQGLKSFAHILGRCFLLENIK